MNRIAIVNRIAGDDFPHEWELGYMVGTNMAGFLDWGIEDVISTAMLVSMRAGIPGLAGLSSSFKNSLRQLSPGWKSDSRVAEAASKILKVKSRLGDWGVIGAVAGVLEDANAHSEAGLVYALGKKMIGMTASTAFEPGFPEMSEADWAALEQSHREKSLREEKNWQQFFRQQREQDDVTENEFRERERRLMQRTRRELGLASEVVKIAKSLLAATSLDGMNRRKAVNKINEVLHRHTKGFFTDDSWAPVNAIWKALTDEGIDWTLEGTQYDHNRDQVPTSKTWKFKVDFVNEKARPVTIYGVVVASGAGTVEDPLSRYDLVAYVS